MRCSSYFTPFYNLTFFGSIRILPLSTLYQATVTPKIMRPTMKIGGKEVTKKDTYTMNEVHKWTDREIDIERQAVTEEQKRYK
jgi:hypothetical protein